MPGRGRRDSTRYSNHVLATIKQNDFAKKLAIQQIKYIYDFKIAIKAHKNEYFKKQKNYLNFIKIFNFLGQIPKFMQALFHSLFPFLDFLGHVMHFCKFS
jgi:DNA-binding transcriptional regulator WhiA